MPLTLMYITNDPAVALIAEKHGVDRIWIDLETKGKELRQKNMNTVKSHHSISDIGIIAPRLTKSELMVRVNAWDEESVDEVERVLEAGAQRIMLPMWKTMEEVDAFLKVVNRRVPTTLLLETKEAVEILDQVLEHPLVDEIHIGLNDLHLSYGLSFMFELLANGTVEALCKKISAKGISYGFGGIARIGGGLLPAEHVIMEHARLGSTVAILSRSFCDINASMSLEKIDELFRENIRKIREYEEYAAGCAFRIWEENKVTVAQKVATIVAGKGV